MDIRKLQNAVNVAARLGGRIPTLSNSNTLKPWTVELLDPLNNSTVNKCIRVYPGRIFGWYGDGQKNVTLFSDSQDCYINSSFVETNTCIVDGDVIGLMIYPGTDTKFLCSSCILPLCVFEFCYDECVTTTGYYKSSITPRSALYIVRCYPSCSPSDTDFTFYPLAVYSPSQLGFIPVTTGDIYIGGSGGAVISCTPPLAWDMMIENCAEGADCAKIKVYAPVWMHDGYFARDNATKGWMEFDVCANSNRGYVLGKYCIQCNAVAKEIIFCGDLCQRELDCSLLAYAVFGTYCRDITVVFCEATGEVDHCEYNYSITQLSHGIPNTYKQSLVTGPICFAPSSPYLCPGVVFPGRIVWDASLGRYCFQEVTDCEPLACYYAKRPDLLFIDDEEQSCTVIAHARGWVFGMCDKEQIFKVDRIDLTNKVAIIPGENETTQGRVDVTESLGVAILTGINSDITKTTNTILYTETIDANELTTYEGV